MPMSVVYTTVNGQILCENRGGVVSHFVSDPLGSVVMVRDNAGNTVYEAEYDPYGNVQSETGTNPSEFGYVGTLGYVKDSAFSLYVRARYLLTNLGRWLTKDPLWPNEPGFVYARATPAMWVDMTGLVAFLPALHSCSEPCHPPECCDKQGNPRPIPCTDHLTNPKKDKPSPKLLECLKKAGDNPKEIKKCLKQHGGFVQAACDYIGCQAGSNIAGGNPGYDPICGRDDYPKCYATYIAALCRCMFSGGLVARVKCIGKADTAMKECVAAADPYDGGPKWV